MVIKVGTSKIVCNFYARAKYIELTCTCKDLTLEGRKMTAHGFQSLVHVRCKIWSAVLIAIAAI
jgi:hypothetical protein